MVTSPLPRAMSFWRENGKKVIRYVGVAAIMVPAGLATLTVLLWLTDWKEWQANFVGTILMMTPNYLLNRYYVWQKNDANRLVGEVVPFVVMALIGLLVSTVAVAIVASLGAPRFLALVVNFCSFGAVWVVRFFVLDRYVFTKRSEIVA